MEKKGPSIMLDKYHHLSVVGNGPTEKEVEVILGEMIDRGIGISLEGAMASTTLVEKAKAIFEVREQKRLKEAEEMARKEAEEALRRREVEERRMLSAAEAVLDQMLEAETAPPAPPEAIATFVEAIKTRGSESVATDLTVVARPDVVKVQDLVIKEFDGITVVEPIQVMKQKFGSDLPELVFLCWQLAAAFRGWLAKYKRRVLDALKAERQKLSSEQDGDFIGVLEERIGRFDGLFEKINEVITGGWSKDPKKDMAEPSFFFRVEKELDGNAKFSYLREVPKRLTAEEKQKQADEAKSREAAAKAREQCVVAVRNRLTIVGFSVDEAEKMSSSWLRKWDGGLNVVEILTTKAINLAISGETDKAKRVAESAGILADAFGALVGAKKAELAELAAKQAAAALVNRGPQAGAMAPRAKPKSKKDEGNKKRGGKEVRRH